MAEKIAVIGAGLVGSLQAIYLAKRGFDVEVYERRSDQRKSDFIGGKSINLALSDRGWKALEGVGISDEIRNVAIPMRGRMMHAVDGTLTEQPYGKEGQAIYSVSRGGLNQVLMNLAEPYSNIDYFFDLQCKDIDLKTNTVKFKNSKTGEDVEKKFDRIFGADGAFSKVRMRLQRTDRFNYSQTYLEHGYKELEIKPNADGSHKLAKNYLHIWPRGQYMLIALPNTDGSFTCTLFFPFDGDKSFNSLETREDVMEFFEETFPDVLGVMPNLLDDYFENPTSSLMIVKCTPWNYEDKIIVLGDASHAIVPFYGQGMNAGFEDCTVFNEMFEEFDGDFEKLLPEFSKRRKPDADAISDLALRNFIEMRDLTANPEFLLQKKIERHFANKHPEKWMPLYSQVTFSHIPYSQAIANGEKQDAIMKEVMTIPDLESIWDSKAVENKMIELIG